MQFNWKKIGIISAVMCLIVFFGSFFLVVYKAVKEDEQPKQDIVQLEQNLQKEMGE
jgi:hypothetical protein